MQVAEPRAAQRASVPPSKNNSICACSNAGEPVPAAMRVRSCLKVGGKHPELKAVLRAVQRASVPSCAHLHIITLRLR